MKVSVITVVFNGESYIEDCIKSVLSQEYNDLEYIIIDGGSTDNTLELIRGLSNRIDKIVSEKDKGIYDAMNKGIAMASGDIIGILNSDDIYYDSDVIQKVVSRFQETQVEAVYGDLVYFKNNEYDKVVRYWSCGTYMPGSFLKGWHPPHPSFFAKKNTYEKYGLYNDAFSIAADFELMLRFFEIKEISSSYIKAPLVKMRLGGASTKSLDNIFKGRQEVLKAFRMNGLEAPRLYFLNRYLQKGFSYLKARIR